MNKIGTLIVTYINGSKDYFAHTTKHDFERMLGEMTQYSKTFIFDYNDAKAVVMLDNVLSMWLNYDEEKENENKCKSV